MKYETKIKRTNERVGRVMIAQGLIINDGQFLMVKQDKYGKIYWNFPGGHIEEGETPEETCIREIYEETGFNVRIKEYIGKIYKKHIFLVEIISGVMKLEIGLLDIAWVTETEEDKWDSKTLEILEHYKTFIQKNLLL
jgi:8-oxo-dGTP diphosphatase